MTKITTNTFFAASNDWSQAEIETAAEEYNKIKDTLERVALGKRDTVVLAGAAVRIFEEHGENSPLYKDFLESLKQNAPGWHDKFFRARAYDAYRGYNALAGADSDKEFVWKLKPSLSALTECQNIHPSQQYDFLKDLKSKDKFPTKDAVSNFASGKRLTSTKTPTYEAPPTPVYQQEPTPYLEPEPTQQSEPINITAQVVLPEEPQQAVVDQLIECLQKMNLDELYCNEEQLKQLKPYLIQMETLYGMVQQTSTNRPTYV